MDVREKLVELCEDLETLPCCDTYEGQAECLIANGVMVQKWISVAEPPKEYRDEVDKGFRMPTHIPDWINEEINEEVTHWLPMPEPPKED